MSEDFKNYVSPNGSPILGTLERLTGRAEIIGIEANGEPVYEGSTEIFYDDQVTETHDGKMVFLDENGAEWTFDQLIEEGNAVKCGNCNEVSDISALDESNRTHQQWRCPSCGSWENRTEAIK